MRKLVLLLAALTALCACNPQPQLVILHTNDTHSHFEPVRGGENDGIGGVIERAAYVDSIRNAYGADRVLLLHAGDFSQGTPYFTELGGVLEMNTINDFGYDCLALGNHEFDNDIEALTERAKMLRPETKLVCANKAVYLTVDGYRNLTSLNCAIYGILIRISAYSSCIRRRGWVRLKQIRSTRLAYTTMRSEPLDPMPAHHLQGEITRSTPCWRAMLFSRT